MERGRAPAEDDDVVRLVVVPGPRGRPGEGEDEQGWRRGHHIGVEQEVPGEGDTDRCYSDGC